MPMQVSKKLFYHVALLWLVAILISQINLYADMKRVRPLTREELQGSWCGLSDDDSYFIRLTFSDNTGVLGIGEYLSGIDDVYVYKLFRITLEGGRLSVYLRPIGSDQIGIEKCDGVIRGGSIVLSLAGKDWKIRTTLRPEARLERVEQLVRRKMNKSGSQ